MALTQMQIIQSLGEAMNWFERELSWGVPPTELRHLCGRIGELYAALICNGQMATEVNQRGYDVVSGDGERVSVKTTATSGSSGMISFNANTLELIDRVIVLRINTDEMQVETLLNAPILEALELMSPEANGKRTLTIGKLTKVAKPRESIKAVKEAQFEGYIIRELETGSIEVECNSAIVSPAKPVLRQIAKRLHISLLNSNGNTLNTRQLGSQIVKALAESAPNSS
jgi:hypothetical protein